MPARAAVATLRVDAGRQRTARRRVPLAAVVVLAVLVPFYLGDYALFQLAEVFSLAVAVLALNLLTGYTGLISVGHGALMGFGGYTTVILTVKAGVPYPAAIAGGAVVGFAVGLVLGVPSLRISGLYLALVTLGTAIVFPPLVKRFADLTGGVSGIGYLPPEAPFGLALTSAQWVYLLTLAVLLAAMLGVSRLVRGRIGRALRAIRENELMAAAQGIDIGRTKILVFAVSAALAGVAGGLYQQVVGTVLPDTYMVTLSIALLTACVVGGAETIVGAVLGAAFVVYAPTYAASIGDRGPQLIYAVALLAVVYFFRGGVAGTLERLWHRLQARRGAA